MSRAYLLLALVACTALAVTNTTMPSYYAVGKTPYELGVSIGQQQKEAFQKLLLADSALIKKLRPWMEDNQNTFASFRKRNEDAYPEIMQEILGIADGAGLKQTDTILLMLRPEIEALNGTKESQHNDNCFDIINNPPEGDKGAFIAHNEDWTPPYKAFGFVLHENMPFSTGAKHITAFTYPACPVGFTFGYNDKGVVTSCNGLNPKPCRPGMLGRYFINRDVLAATSVEDALNRLRKAAPDSALGFGMSIGMVGSHELYHAEMAPYDPKSKSHDKGYVDIIKIEAGNSYLHSNSYTHEYMKDIDQYTSESTKHRLERAKEMPAPTTPKLALDILGDEKDKQYPIYRYGNLSDPEELATISTAIMNLDTAEIAIYGGNPTQWDPVVVMPLYRPYVEESLSSDSTDYRHIAAILSLVVLIAAIIIVILLVVCSVTCCCFCCKGRGASSVNSDAYHRF